MFECVTCIYDVLYREGTSEPPKIETLTYQAVLQNELLGKSISEVPVSGEEREGGRKGGREGGREGREGGREEIKVTSVCMYVCRTHRILSMVSHLPQ